MSQPLFEASSAVPAAAETSARGPFDRIEIFETFAAAAPVWAELEASGSASAYQLRPWLEAWMGTIGAAHGAVPMLIAAFGPDRGAQALLPLCVANQGLFRVARFMGGRASNGNLGLFRPDVASSRGDIESLLRRAARAMRQGPDVFVLMNQPEVWAGRGNPLAALSRQPSASYGHSATLAPDFAAYATTRLSSDARKKLTKKRKRLEKIYGPVRYVVARGAQDTSRALDVFFEQKLRRFRERGIASEFDDPAMRAFLERTCVARDDEQTPLVELHALFAGERSIAIYGGVRLRERFFAMFNSFDASDGLAQSSPGDLLLMAMIEEFCRSGLKTFDLGIGEARYKDVWCETTEPLFDAIVPVTAKGRAFALGESARLLAKRTVKQTPWIWARAQRIRAWRVRRGD